jgi:hypothetical protein
MPAYMNRRLALLLVLASIVLVTRTARAQGAGQGQGQGEVTIGYQGLPYKASGETATGIQVSEGVLMHVGAGAETGYDSNVFYEGINPRGAAMIRSSIFADMSNATRSGAVGRLSFQMRGGLTYRRYQSSDQDVQNFANAWMPSAGLALSTSSGQFGFGLADTFVRLEDPPYNPGQPQPITRYNNQGSAELRWAPGGGRLSSMLRYTNMIDWFAEVYNYASSMTNSLMLDVSWKWLPKTAIFVNVTQGIVTYFEAGTPKAPSYPLRVTAGIRGLLTEKTSVALALGYTNAFYSGPGPSTSGFYGSTFGDLSFTVRPTMLSRVVLGYRHSFENSVISNFYYAETAYASYVQQIAGRLALDLSGRYVYKDYQGTAQIDPAVAGRVDNFFQVGATLDYFVRNWIYAGVGYAMILNRGDVTPSPLAPPGPPPDVNYTKQQVFFRLGITY